MRTAEIAARIAARFLRQPVAPPPADGVLAPAPAEHHWHPVRVIQRDVTVDAPALSVTFALGREPAGAPTPRFASGLVRRLVERGTRQERSAERVRIAGDAAPIALGGGRATDARPAADVRWPRAAHRAAPTKDAAPAAPGSVPTPASATLSMPSTPPTSRSLAPAPWPVPAAPVALPDVERLADRVLRVIERRLQAARERRGRRS